MLWARLLGPGGARLRHRHRRDHNEEGAERGLGQRLRYHPRMAYVTSAPSLAVAAGPPALPGLPTAP